MTNKLKQHEIGRQPEIFYQQNLNKSRFHVRKGLMLSLRKESEIMAKFQHKFRRKWLDKYMLWSSFLGTVTFFILLIPIPYFWGHADRGRALLQTLAASVWITCLMKDFCCVPRPYSPPVTRITMGTSHLEYGFPSTHSTTAVAQALVLNNWLSDATADGSVEPFTMSILRTLLIIATSSVVFGRFYCGMHSALDCFSGVMTGSLIYITRSYIGPYYEAFIEQPNYLTPILLTILSLYAIHAHIEPAEDNPAFEDSVAFISVFLGNGIGEWIACNYGFHHATYFVTKLTGWEWCLASLFKYPLGVGLIFLTRLLCKPIMQAVLPPLFRVLHKIIKLPNRTGYVPATEYESYKPAGDSLNPIPSVVDLAQLKHVKETHSSKQATEVVGEERPTISQTTHKKFSPRHYDADVMTRVVSYAAMGFVGTIIAPIIFEKLGWGLF